MANVSLMDTLFNIKEVPAYWESTNINKGNGTSVREMETNHKFIVREDNNKVLSCMTDDYKVVTNKELIDTAVPILKNYDANLVEAISLGDGQKTVWKWRIPDVKITLGDKDTDALLEDERIAQDS